MLSSSIIASSLASRVKEQARMAAEKSYYTELLLGSSQKAADHPDGVGLSAPDGGAAQPHV